MLRTPTLISWLPRLFAYRNSNLLIRVAVVVACELAILWRLMPAMTSSLGIGVLIGVGSIVILTALLLGYVLSIKGKAATLVAGSLFTLVSYGYFMPNGAKLAHIDDGLELLYVFITAGFLAIILVCVVAFIEPTLRVPLRPDPH